MSTRSTHTTPSSPAPAPSPGPKQPVTLIGLGPMGQAMAGVLLDAGHPVTLWNRTASRAEPLVARGAHLAATAQEAVTANELTILSLTGYDAMYDVLGPAADAGALAGRTVVNLSSDTPERTREGARWVTAHGAEFVAGGVNSPPPGIGDPAMTTFYSGSTTAFERHRGPLAVLTGTDFRGEDPGTAALVYQLGMIMFWTSMLSYLQAVALAEANGISADALLPHAVDVMESVPNFQRFYSPRIEAGNHEGDVDRLAMGVASVEHIVHTLHDSGVDATLPEAVRSVFARGVAEGHAADSFSSLVDVLKKPAA